MIRGLLCVAVVLGLFYSASTQSENLSEEPLLQQRITVSLKMEPMRNALRQIGRQTGVSLRCQDVIADEKVLIFVEERPAHEILTQLAKVFRSVWRKHEDGGYLFYVPDKTRLQEEKIVNAMREARRRALRELVQIAREVRKLSIVQRREETRLLRERPQPLTPREKVRLSVLSGMTPTVIWSQTHEGEMVETAKYYFLEDYAVYHCLAALPDRALALLRQIRKFDATTLNEMERMLEKDPGARVMEVRLRGYVIEFFTENGERKHYRFVLSRLEPYTLPERKVKQEELGAERK